MTRLEAWTCWPGLGHIPSNRSVADDGVSSMGPQAAARGNVSRGAGGSCCLGPRSACPHITMRVRRLGSMKTGTCGPHELSSGCPWCEALVRTVSNPVVPSAPEGY